MFKQISTIKGQIAITDQGNARMVGKNVTFDWFMEGVGG